MVLFPSCRLVPVVGARIASWVQFNMGRCLRVGFSYRSGHLKQDVGPPRGMIPQRFRVYLQSFEPLEVLLEPRARGVLPFGHGAVSSACRCRSAVPATACGKPGVDWRRRGTGSGPGWPVGCSPCIGPVLSPSGVVPAPGGGAAPCAPGGCSTSARARVALPAWLPPRPRFVRGRMWVPTLLVRLSWEVSWPGFSVAASWPSGDRGLSVAATGRSR